MGGAIEPDRKNAGADLPLLKALGGYFVCIVLSLVVQLATQGLVRQAAGIIIGATALWLIPLQYGGRSYSLRDDRRMKTTVLAFSALSDDEIPTHPAWWREGGEPSRRVIRVAIWLAAGLSLAGALSFVAAPPLAPLGEVVWAACWISPFLILWNTRSARREKFRLKVEGILRESDLESVRSTRRTLHAEVETYENRLKSIGESSNATLRLAIEDLLHQVRSDQAKARRREVLFAVGGVAAGLVLSIASHQVGLT